MDTQTAKGDQPPSSFFSPVFRRPIRRNQLAWQGLRSVGADDGHRRSSIQPIQMRHLPPNSDAFNHRHATLRIVCACLVWLGVLVGGFAEIGCTRTAYAPHWVSVVRCPVVLLLVLYLRFAHNPCQSLTQVVLDTSFQGRIAILRTKKPRAIRSHGVCVCSVVRLLSCGSRHVMRPTDSACCQVNPIPSATLNVLPDGS